jgi:hypothetical protein
MYFWDSAKAKNRRQLPDGPAKIGGLQRFDIQESYRSFCDAIVIALLLELIVCFQLFIII